MNLHVLTDGDFCVVAASTDPEQLAGVLLVVDLDLNRWVGETPPVLGEYVSPAHLAAPDEDMAFAVKWEFDAAQHRLRDEEFDRLAFDIQHAWD